jgi:hypothetical protein
VAGSAIPHYSCHVEGAVAAEDAGEDLVVDFVAEVAAEYAVVVLGPVLHRFVLPDFACGLSEVSVIFLFGFLYFLGFVGEMGVGLFFFVGGGLLEGLFRFDGGFFFFLFVLWGWSVFG